MPTRTPAKILQQRQSTTDTPTDTQVLTFDSASNTWVASDAAGGAAVVMTTKGDLAGFSTVRARIPIGANDLPLIADSGEALGLKWGALPVAGGGTGVTSSTGTTNVVLSNSPTLVTPALGTPASGVATNITGLPLSSGVTGTLPVANGGTGVTTSTGTVNTVLSNSPTLVTPALGTPASGVMTNMTGLPVAGLADGTDGELITWSSTGVAAVVAVGTSGQVLTSNGVGAAPTFQAGGGGSSKTFAKIVKGADETVNNSSTLQDDDELTTSLNANKEYGFLVTIWTVSNTTADFKYAFPLNGNTGVKILGGFNSSPAIGTDSMDTSTTIGTSTAELSLGIIGHITTGGSAGAFTLQWAQNTATVVDTKVLKGSTMLVWEE